MNERKMKLGWFTVAQWEQEERWLRKQHQAGWAFVSFVPPCFYTFERCEPQDVVYQLDYNQEGAKGKAGYVQMFEDCGWEYLSDFLGYSYFRKAASQMAGPEEIFCDDESRLEMIHRVLRGRAIPLLVMFCCIIVPQMIHGFFRASASDVAEIHWLFYVLVALFILYSVTLLRFALLYWRAGKAVKQRR